MFHSPAIRLVDNFIGAGQENPRYWLAERAFAVFWFIASTTWLTHGRDETKDARMTSGHRWTFKARFREGAYGWRGSALASKRLKEAVREIKSVAKSDRMLAAEGAVSLMERLWPALEHIDTSSGALGSAVHQTLEDLIPILISAPADMAMRSAWLERLYQAVLDDGVQYEVLRPGSGPTPAPDGRVTVHYQGTLLDGRVFDSSYRRSEPSTFQVDRTIAGWRKVLALMKEGAKWRVVVPAELGYGETGVGDEIPPNATLLFDIELIAANVQ